MNPIIIAVLSIALSVAAQFSLKAGMSADAVKQSFSRPASFDSVLVILTNKFILGGFLLYGLGAVLWLGVLSRWDVSKAYPMVGLGFVLTLGVGFILGEQITVARLAGSALILFGVVVISQT